MGKTTPELNECFFDMGKYWNETDQPEKIEACKKKYSNMPAFNNRIKWLDKGVSESRIENHSIPVN